VLGPGLIGGSLLRAIRQREPATELRAWARRTASLDELRSEPGLVDLASDQLPETVEAAEVVVLAMPVEHMAGVVERIPAFAPGALVTDVGSVKASVVRSVEPLVAERGGVFLGSHPMAGSEKKGLRHAEADLFHGAPVILTPKGAETESSESFERLKHFWSSLGGRIVVLDPEQHDRLVAGISHLPHLVAAALARTVLLREPASGELSGGGFRDTTRVAGGPEEMWSGILGDNAVAVSEWLGHFIAELQAWQEALDTLDRERLRDLLCQARCLRETLPPKVSGEE
jgi:prephenate dehydrogenase